MKNRIDNSTINTGGMVSHHSREDVNVRVPQKVTGNVPEEKLPGVAKASPNFKSIEIKTPNDEKHTIAKFSQVVPEQESEQMSVKELIVVDKTEVKNKKLND